MNCNTRQGSFIFGAVFVALPIFGLAQAPTSNTAGLQAAAGKVDPKTDDTPHVTVHSGIVQVRIHNVTTPAYAPLEGLATVIQRYPNANLYCVTWGCFYGRHSGKATVLYDRRQHSLRYYCKGTVVPWGNFYKHTAFSGVTNKILAQDAKDQYGTTRQLPFENDADSVFDNLLSYGCVRHDFPPPAVPKATSFTIMSPVQ